MKKSFLFKCFFLLGTVVLFSVVLYARGIKFKEMEFSNPKYLGRKGAQWEKGGRLVGVVRRPPETYTIEIRKSSCGEPILSEIHYGYLSIYETAFIRPGKYHLTVKAPGYADQRLQNLEIKTGTDCVLNITFGTVEYEK